MLANYALLYNLLHPVRCPDKRGKDMIVIIIFCVHVGLNLRVFSETYESETPDVQVDGS